MMIARICSLVAVSALLLTADPPPPVITASIDGGRPEVDHAEFAVWTNPGGKPVVANYESDDTSCRGLGARRGTVVYTRVRKNVSQIRVNGLRERTGYCLVVTGVAGGTLKEKRRHYYSTAVRMSNPRLNPSR